MSTLAITPPAPPTAPPFTLPRGACDCDAHVVGPFDVYPLAALRPYDPPEVPAARLRQMMDKMGIDRVVIAHVSVHGMDLSVTLDAIAELGNRARGTAMLRPDVNATRLEALHAAGMRGVRLSRAYGAETAFDEQQLRLWADKVAPFRWHLALWPSSLQELQLLERVAPRLPVPVVLDHLASHGWFEDGQVREEGLAVLHALLATGRAWLKLSGMGHAGAGHAPWQALMEPIARLASAHLDRMLWGSHWPFLGGDTVRGLRSGELLDWVERVGLDAVAREQVLVRNPEKLYGFPAAAWG
jgi:2-pyrone-4,6-dicarboxylate lactonase